MDEEVKPEESKNQPKFIAVVKTDDGKIGFNLNGVTMEEAFLLLTRGKIKFEKTYENWLREQG
jgi:hypothetical protein